MPQHHGAQPDDLLPAGHLDAAVVFADQVMAEFRRKDMAPSPETYVMAMELGLRIQGGRPATLKGPDRPVEQQAAACQDFAEDRGWEAVDWPADEGPPAC